MLSYPYISIVDSLTLFYQMEQHETIGQLIE
jgi:hypothetical protein